MTKLTRDEGNLHLSETTLLAWCLNPSQVRELAINGAAYDFTVDGLEALNVLTADKKRKKRLVRIRKEEARTRAQTSRDG